MDNRPIGFFDSGLGGLTCISHFKKKLPNESIIYFGDTARTPYGSKAVSTIMAFSEEVADFLVNMDVKMIVIACNTVSSIALSTLRKKHPDIPIIGIIEASSLAISKIENPDPVGIIGTKVTIESHAHKHEIKKQFADLKIYETACPAFVPLIEEGIIENDIMDLTIKYYLDHLVDYYKIKNLILGCTHYPLILPNIERIYPDLSVIDPSKEIVNLIEDSLKENKISADEKNKTDHKFYASDLSENFIMMINRIFKDSGFNVAFKSF